MSKQASFEKIAECLYRNLDSNSIFALLKIKGKQIKKSLETESLPEAKRKLRELRDSLERTDRAAAKRNLRYYAEHFLAITPASPSAKFQKVREKMIKTICDSWPGPGGSDIAISTVTADDIRTFLNRVAGDAGWSRYNSWLQLLRRIFQSAFEAQALIEIPGVRGVAKKQSVWQLRKSKDIKSLVPSVAQFRAIVCSIRSQEFADTREESADFVEAEGTLGLGQAEIAGIRRKDVSFSSGSIKIVRVKTGQPFDIPVYPQARALIERRLKNIEADPETPLFSINDAKKSVAAACRRLGFPGFTQRSFRKMFVTEALRVGVNVKQVAALQGHRDGGKLILKTYSDVVSEKDREAAGEKIAAAFAA